MTLERLKARLKRPIEECLQEMLDDLDAKDAEIDRLRGKLADLEKVAAAVRHLMGRERLSDEDCKLLGKLESGLGRLTTERDEAHGDAEREYGLRMLAEKERDEARQRIAKLEAVVETARGCMVFPGRILRRAKEDDVPLTVEFPVERLETVRDALRALDEVAP